ncbi:MAG: hypothetical protein IPN24_13535 [Betaproteobacteria bacterium]|nr:hypothetical protein [Betaproteobacteria bacterium]
MDGTVPAAAGEAAALIAGSALVSSLICADKVVVKTVDEALGVPRAEINAEAVDTVAYMLRIFASATPMTSTLVEEEAALIESEVGDILDSVFGLSGDMFWESVFRAFQLGYLDVPFSPHADNANRLLTKRDARRSIRIVDRGHVPISKEDLRREHQLLASVGGRQDKNYRQLLGDINMMMV